MKKRQTYRDHFEIEKIFFKIRTKERRRGGGRGVRGGEGKKTPHGIK